MSKYRIITRAIPFREKFEYVVEECKNPMAWFPKWDWLTTQKSYEDAKEFVDRLLAVRNKVEYFG